VLTEKDFGGDKQRYIEFKNYCDEYDFRFYVVDKGGKRREFPCLSCPSKDECNSFKWFLTWFGKPK